MKIRLDDDSRIGDFEAIVLPHLDAAYNLARWLTRDEHDAEDLVQMAFMRAFRFFAGFRGGDARAWLLTIVRHTYYTALRDSRREQNDVSFDEEVHGRSADDTAACGLDSNPESILASDDARRAVNQALERLPRTFREIVVLKEMDELSYREIAEIAGIPIGTVMSRLARGRKLLAEFLKRDAIGG